MECVKAKLLDELDLTSFGGAAELFIAPRSSGAALNFAWVQSMGIFLSELYLGIPIGLDRKGFAKMVSNALKLFRIPGYQRFAYLKKADRGIFQMVFTDAKGEVLWKYGESAPGGMPYCSHQGERLVAMADINGDGEDEILAIFKPGRLGMFCMADGKLLKECKLPADNFSIVCAGRSGGRPRDWTILVGVGEAAYPPHTYSNPVLLLDSDFNTIKQLDVLAGIGHCPQVFDANGDGLDEFLVGYSLISHEGEILWVVKGIGEPSGQVDAKTMHADCIEIIDRGQPNAWRAAIAGSDTTYLLDHNGTVLWKQPGIHPQHIMSGRFNPDTSERCLFLLHCRKMMELLDMDGTQIWQGLLPSHWPMGRPIAVKNDYAFHMGRPASVWHEPLEADHDLIVYNEAGWPYAVNGCGQLCVEFPCPVSARQKEYNIPRRHRPDDYGYGYRCIVADVNNDAKEEVIIYDRQHAWIYGIA